MKTINKVNSQVTTLIGSVLFLLSVTFIITGFYAIITNLF